MYQTMKNICENEYNYFFALPNVVGVGIGNKTIKGIDTITPCLKVLVEEKVQQDKLLAQDMVPGLYKGILTDVIEVGHIAIEPNTSKVRPAPGGYSIGLAGSSSAGTLGCLVTIGTGSNLKTYILSNNHVIASNNTAPIGSLILQPAQGDGGANPGDGIANLSSFVTINFAGGNNLVDAAIGQVISTSLVTSSITSIGNITGIASAEVGGGVKKSGRTTSFTSGKITSINTTVTVDYNPGGAAQNATFIRQIVATSMSQAGDSGSIVVDPYNRVVGLLFAGSSSTTIMNDIREVLKSFRARLL